MILRLRRFIRPIRGRGRSFGLVCRRGGLRRVSGTVAVGKGLPLSEMRWRKRMAHGRRALVLLGMCSESIGDCGHGL